MPLHVADGGIEEDRLREVARQMEKLQEREEEFRKEVWQAISKTNENVAALSSAVAGLTGKMTGYFVAATVIVGIVGFIAAQVLHHN